MEHNLTLKTYMAIMAERDAAIRERNMALDERKRLFAERDMAMLQRDAALAERNSAIEERNKALAALQLRESSMTEDNVNPDGTKHLYHQQQMHDLPWLAGAAYDPIPNDPVRITGVASDTAKPKKAKQTKETAASSTRKLPKASGKGKREAIEVSTEVTGAASSDWANELDFGSDDDDDDLEEQPAFWRENSGLNQINFDGSVMPVPVCSCTGMSQPCYKWGNGGWQSACCTTTASMYPLPLTSGKHQARVGGRKMTGSAFTKLLNRLVAEGHDLSTPLDLKNYWAKPGTSHYGTLN